MEENTYQPNTSSVSAKLANVKKAIFFAMKHI